MARTPEGARLTALHQRQQIALRAATIKDILKLYPMWSLDDPASYERFVQAVILLVRARATNSAALAARYYQVFKAADLGVIADQIPLAAAPAAEQIATSVAATARAGTYRALASGMSRASALNQGLVQVSGSASRHVLNTGRETITRAVQNDRDMLGWIRVSDGDPCAFCSMLLGRGPVYKEETADFQSHDHCVIGSTRVNGPSFEVGYRRLYEGELVIVRTADGDELSITPNHPVLTDRGWVAAGLLQERDQVVKRVCSERNLALVPDEKDAPSPIEDVWRALRVNGLVSVPVAAEDFHGDGAGSHGDVDIVSADGFLSRVSQTSAREQLGEVVGSGALATSVACAFPSESDSALMQFGVGLATASGVGGSGVGGAGSGVERSLAQRGSLFDGSSRDTSVAQPTHNDTAGDPVFVGQGLCGLPGDVCGAEPGRGGYPIVSAGARPRFDPPANHGNAETLGVHANLGRDLLERLSGGVLLSRVRHLRRVKAKCHVYNLQTAEGWYEANGLIVSNCACGAEPFAAGSSWPAKNREAQDLYYEAVGARKDGESVVNAMRRLQTGQ